MLTRRHIRIKVFQTVYAYIFSHKTKVHIGEKELVFNLDKTHELYLTYLTIFKEIKDFALQKIEDAKNKNFPTEDELNPNMKFVENKVFDVLEENLELNNFIKKRKIKWETEADFNIVKQIWQGVKASDEYREYMNSGQDSLHEDKQFLIWVFKNHIAINELLYDILEDKSIYWNDDLETILSSISSTIDGIGANSDSHYKLRPLYKGEEDLDFAKRLFRRTLANEEECSKLIHNQAENWDLDRFAKSDLILMQMAITEALDFPSIPIKVTLNEYIEISKFYSTPKSKQFINGLLDKVFNELKQSGRINKAGRGLINKSIK